MLIPFIFGVVRTDEHRDLPLVLKMVAGDNYLVKEAVWTSLCGGDWEGKCGGHHAAIIAR
jgi:hypothetical protein